MSSATPARISSILSTRLRIRWLWANRTNAVAVHRIAQKMSDLVCEFCRYSFMPCRLGLAAAVSSFHSLVRAEHPGLGVMGEADVGVVPLRRGRRQQQQLRVLPRQRLGAADQLLPDPLLLMRLPH